MVKPRERLSVKIFCPIARVQRSYGYFSWHDILTAFPKNDFIFPLRGIFSIIAQTHGKVTDNFLDLLAFSEYQKFEIIIEIIFRKEENVAKTAHTQRERERETIVGKLQAKLSDTLC